MDHRFFEQPILNSPFEFPARHWELDDRRRAFAEIYTTEPDFETKVAQAFDRMIDRVAGVTV